MFHQARSKAEKALALIEARKMSSGSGTTVALGLQGVELFGGTYGERWFLRYILNLNTAILF